MCHCAIVSLTDNSYDKGSCLLQQGVTVVTDLGGLVKPYLRCDTLNFQPRPSSVHYDLSATVPFLCHKNTNSEMGYSSTGVLVKHSIYPCQGNQTYGTKTAGCQQKVAKNVAVDDQVKKWCKYGLERNNGFLFCNSLWEKGEP